MAWAVVLILLTGRFALIESNNVPIESNLPTEGRVDPVPTFRQWRGTDAKWLVIGRVKQDQRLLVRFQLWDVVNGHQFLGQQYVLRSEDDMQRVPHVMAEQIFKKLTGESGPSDGAANRNWSFSR